MGPGSRRPREGVLARVIEVQIRRQDFHYSGPRALRDAPDESLRQMHLDVVLLARNRVCEGRDSHRTSDVDDKVAVPRRGAAAMAQASLTRIRASRAELVLRCSGFENGAVCGETGWSIKLMDHGQ